MTDDPERPTVTQAVPTIGQIWRQLPLEQRQAMLEDFWQDEESGDQQVEALALLVQRFKFRPKTARTLPVGKKARYLVGMSSLPDSIAARALVSHHFLHRRPMMVAFLDALGLTHEDGVISDEVVKPDPEKLDAAVAVIAATYPREDVALYLATLAAQDAEAWGTLADRAEAKPSPEA